MEEGLGNGKVFNNSESFGCLAERHWVHSHPSETEGTEMFIGLMGTNPKSVFLGNRLRNRLGLRVYFNVNAKNWR